MCQSGCIYENYAGDCTNEKNKGTCPLLVEAEKERLIKLLFVNLHEGSHKCNECIFAHQCEELSSNYKDDICQTIAKNYESLGEV